MEFISQENKASHKYSVSEFLFICTIILFAGLIRLPSITQPLGPDQGIMSVIGSGILDGKLPYRDFFEMASPAIFFTYALMFKIFGKTMMAIPLTDIFVSMITTLLVYFLARSVWNKQAAFISAFAFALFSSGVRFGMHAGGDIAFGTFWYISQRETFMLPLIVAGLLLIIKSDRTKNNWWLIFGSAFFMGIAFVYKFPAALFSICIFIHTNVDSIFRKRPLDIKRIILNNLALMAGFLLALLPFIIFFLIKGAFNDMIEIIFGYVYSVYGHANHDFFTVLSTGVRRTFFLAQENFLLWVFFIAAPIYIIFNERTKDNLLIVLWALAAALYVISHQEFFGYHFLMILPPFSVLTGYGIVKVFGSDRYQKKISSHSIGKIILVFLMVANLIFFTTFVHAHYTKFIFYTTDRISKEEYYSYFTAYPEHMYSFPADYQVIKYIKNNTNSDDEIFVLGGIESVIYFLTERSSPSRFIFSWIIFQFAHGKVKASEEYRKELLDDLKSATPKYIITVQSIETFKPFLDIYKFVSENYTLVKKFPDDRFVYVHNHHY